MEPHHLGEYFEGQHVGMRESPRVLSGCCKGHHQDDMNYQGKVIATYLSRGHFWKVVVVSLVRESPKLPLDSGLGNYIWSN